MFKHKNKEDHPEVVLETINVIDISETASDNGDIEEEINDETEIENDGDEMIGNDCVNETFYNPFHKTLNPRKKYLNVKSVILKQKQKVTL